jgi:hypothetical protein
MTIESVKNLYLHFCKLAENGGNTGNTTRDLLIKSDALENKKALEKKFPKLLNSPKEEEETENKSKKSKKGSD